ncbi:MAG TPA: hypothetical protein VNF73_03605, partial [Candidatus Saccharimonadales bacterium]|nr:hypothetical protein [Candidatus Saccharimonadales bacterium]
MCRSSGTSTSCTRASCTRASGTSASGTPALGSAGPGIRQEPIESCEQRPGPEAAEDLARFSGGDGDFRI